VAQILVRDLAVATVEQLKKRAKSNNRSLEAEVRGILEEIATREAKRESLIAFMEESRRIHGPQRTDSIDLIREDRDR
jgi:plasmid stability protein